MMFVVKEAKLLNFNDTHLILKVNIYDFKRLKYKIIYINITINTAFKHIIILYDIEYKFKSRFLFNQNYDLENSIHI